MSAPTKKRASDRARAGGSNGSSSRSTGGELSPFSKDVRALLRDMKAGFRVERTGGGHYRIRDPRGGFVTDSEGKNITVVTNPSPGSVRALRDQLKEALVLKGTGKREAVVTDEARANRLEGLRRMQQARDRKRRQEAQDLHKRFEALLEVVGGLDVPGRAMDLGYVGSIIAREQQKPLTPDLLSNSARRVMTGEWTEVKYQEVWNALADRLERSPEPGGEWYLMIREAKGLPGDIVETRLPKGAQDEWPFSVKLIPLDALFVDKYQRPVGWEFVRKEASRFDPALVGTIDVAQRSAGRFAILDGQQRSEIVNLAGKTTIWCSVYEGLDFASEARFFLNKNLHQKNMHPFYAYQAQVIAHDPEAVEIERLLKKYGYKVAIGAPKQGAEDHIAAIAALFTAYRRRDGDDVSTLDLVLRTLKEATFGRENGQTAVLIRGLSRLYFETPAEPEIVIQAVSEVGPTAIIGRARDLSRNMGTNNEQGVARVIAAEYNKRAKGRGSKVSLDSE